ncbi:BTAD domain-containing putative transcriptional regulator [Aquihabitans daechungensis]|uniref:AfsR/SARP family transcriptional regulator n=1 Tax=Aquihabitans daechungensis TaxID=1052257 RepID=UPI003BA2D17C
MDFKVLGPLQVRSAAGGRIPLTSDAQRRLVSVLIMHADASVRSEELEEVLHLSRSALRTSVCRLRRVLRDDVVTTEPPGYAIHGDHIDVDRFERCLALARAAVDDPRRHHQVLEEALALWRGEPYAEFADEPWAACEVQRLTELHCGAIEDIVELELHAADWSNCVARLLPLIDEQPFRDRPRGLLMRALAGAGRQADALRAFAAYRSFLRDESGTLPSPELVALDRAIARTGGLSGSPTDDLLLR